MSSRAYEAYDLRYHHSWDVSSDNAGTGIIRVHEPEQGELQLALPKPIDLRVERDVVEKLVNSYFTDVAPMLPVVTREEFIASNPPPPILLHLMVVRVLVLVLMPLGMLLLVLLHMSGPTTA